MANIQRVYKWSGTVISRVKELTSTTSYTFKRATQEMCSVKTCSSLLLAVAALQVAVVSSAPLYVREARNASECTYLRTDGWASCCDIQRSMTNATTNTSTNITSGVYNLDHYGPFSATYGYCDMETDGGGWLVIFRRVGGNFTFLKRLQDYEDGFGKLETGNTFWYGLKALSHLTYRNAWELRVDLINEDGRMHAHYASFSIGDSRESYKLRLGPYVGDKSTASDNLQVFNGNKFYTKDSDGPGTTRCSCDAGGGWWYTSNGCGGSGILTAERPHLRRWYEPSVEGQRITYEHTEMKIRQLTCNL